MAQDLDLWGPNPVAHLPSIKPPALLPDNSGGGGRTGANAAVANAEAGTPAAFGQPSAAQAQLLWQLASLTGASHGSDQTLGSVQQHLQLPDPAGPSATTASSTAAATTLTLIGSPNPSPAGQVVTEAATIASSDGTTPLGLVAFSVNGAFAGYAPLDGVANNDQATFTSVLLPSGNNTIEADFLGDTQYAASSAVTTQTVTGNAQLVVYAGLAFTDTVTAYNPDGTVNTTYTGTQHFTSSDPAAQLPADYTYQLSDQGTHTFDVTLNSLGYQTITATDTLDPSITATATVFVVPDVADHLAFVQQPSDSVAGQPIAPAVTVAAEDSLGNVVPTGSYQVLLIANGVALFGNNQQTTVNGIATFDNLSIQNAGFGYVLQAGAVGLTDTASAPFSVVPGPTTQLVVIAPSSIVAGNPFDLTVFADDQYFNVTPNYAGTVQFSSSDYAAQLPSNYTFAPGDYGGHTFGNVVMANQGSQTITAGDTVNGISGQTSIEVLPQTPPILINPGDQTSQVGSSVDLQIYATDPDGDTLTYAAGAIPAGLSINPQTGVISGTVTGAPGYYPSDVMVDDGHGNVVDQPFQWLVTLAAAPIADDDFYGVNENTTVNVPAWDGVLANDIYVPGIPLTAQLVAGPTHGSLSLNADGSFIYTPNTNFTGSDSFTYQALQAGLASNIATVTLDVHAANQAPVANADSYTVITGQTLTVTLDQGLLANDYDLDSDPISAQLVSGPHQGTLQLKTDGALVYTPAPGFTGSDTFLYDDFDGLAYSTTAKVTIDVQHAIDLFPPDDQANNEGDAVNLQFPATDANGLPITYSAAGLPPGLSIDPTTGNITGIVPYTDAETNNGKYPVTLTAADGQDSVTDNFTWYITDTNRLTQPDDQVNEPGDVVSLQLQATGGPFTFAAAGLPAGLSINPSTGLISGTITENPNQPRTHTVTVSITGGGSTDSQQFNWTVQNNQPYVDIAINDTESTDDDFTANLQPIPALVTLHDPVPGEHQVQIVVPSGLSTISGGSLLLADGQSAEITIVPQQNSQKEDDVVLVAMLDGKQAGEAKETNAAITVTEHIRNADTPAGMKDRIPPRVITTIQVTVDPTLKGKYLKAIVANQSTDNGKVYFKNGGANGTDASSIFWTTGEGGPLSLVGDADAQTRASLSDPGFFAGHLQAQILNKKGDVLASSDGFSAVRMRNARPVQGGDVAQENENVYKNFWGTEYTVDYVSDSNVLADLDAVEVSEVIRPLPGGTGFAGAVFSNPKVSGFIPATGEPPEDRIGVNARVPHVENGERITFPVARERALQAIQAQISGNGMNQGNGTAGLEQFFRFTDARTGVTGPDGLVIADSGFKMTIVMERTNGGLYFIRTTRVPAEIGAQGNIADPGIVPPIDRLQQSVQIV